LEDLDVDGRIMLKGVVNEYDVVTYLGLVCFVVQNMMIVGIRFREIRYCHSAVDEDSTLKFLFS
jgi:hypothetical protein